MDFFTGQMKSKLTEKRKEKSWRVTYRGGCPPENLAYVFFNLFPFKPLSLTHENVHARITCTWRFVHLNVSIWTYPLVLHMAWTFLYLVKHFNYQPQSTCWKVRSISIIKGSRHSAHTSWGECLLWHVVTCPRVESGYCDAGKAWWIIYQTEKVDTSNLCCLVLTLAMALGR